MAETVPAALEQAARSGPDTPALRFKRGGAWRTMSWREYRDEVHQAARGLIALGVAGGRGGGILGYNRPEWFVADLAAIAAGGVPAGIYTTSSTEQCRYVLAHSEARVAVVEHREHLPAILALRDSLPELRAVVLMEGAAGGEPGVLAWEELLARGEETPGSNPGTSASWTPRGSCA